MPKHCVHCGRTINFVVIDGIVRPIHADNRPCGSARAERQQLLPFPFVFVDAFENPVIKKPCHCPESPGIFEVKHKGGVVRFDRLAWPWVRHRCGHTSMSCDLGLDHLSRELASETHESIKLALVAAAKQFFEVTQYHYVALMECEDTQRRHCWKLRPCQGTATELLNKVRVQSGTLVVLLGNGPARRLKTTSGYDFECVDTSCSPEELDIPAAWLGEPKKVRI